MKKICDVFYNVGKYFLVLEKLICLRNKKKDKLWFNKFFKIVRIKILFGKENL